MSITGKSAGEISIYTVLICRNLCSFKTRQNQIKNQPKRTSLGAGWVPVGLKFVFPWVLAAYFGAGSHREEQELCFGFSGWVLEDPWLRSSSSILTAVWLGLQPIWSAGGFNPTIYIQENPPMQLSRFSLIQERGAKAQVPGSTKRETCLHFFFFSLPFLWKTIHLSFSWLQPPKPNPRERSHTKHGPREKKLWQIEGMKKNIKTSDVLSYFLSPSYELLGRVTIVITLCSPNSLTQSGCSIKSQWISSQT